MSEKDKFYYRLISALRKLLPPRLKTITRELLSISNRHLIFPTLTLTARVILTPLNKRKHKRKKVRNLDIGPGAIPIRDFETLNIVWSKGVDYVCDATDHLPFSDNTFDIVHASHVLEHTPWYALQKTLNEWARILKSNGSLEIWVPDGYKLAKFLVDIENNVDRTEWHDNWRPLNPENNPYIWVNGRILYGARKEYPSWHTAIITPKMLMLMMANAGLKRIQIMNTNDIRGTDHGWINLGIKGFKP